MRGDDAAARRGDGAPLPRAQLVAGSGASRVMVVTELAEDAGGFA